MTKKKVGSYAKLPHGNAWRLTISLGYDKHRKRIRRNKTVYSDDENVVKQELKEFYEEHTVVLTSNKKDFRYMKMILADYCKNNCTLYPQSKVICNNIKCRAYDYVKFMIEKKGI